MTARNSLGSGLQSLPVSILAAKIPDAPINLANVEAFTTAYQIGLIWTEGVYNGGSQVIDYKVFYKEAYSSTYLLFASDLTDATITIPSLTPATSYKFKV